MMYTWIVQLRPIVHLPLSELSVSARTPAFSLIGIRMAIRDIRLQTWTRVIVNRCIGKIIARDPSLVASRLYRMAVTLPQSRVAVTLSPSSGADLLGCIPVLEKRKGQGRKHRAFLPRTYSYEIISPATDWSSSMATFQRIRRTGKLHFH